VKDTISRRDFTKLVSVAASAAALSGCGTNKLLGTSVAEEEWQPRAESSIATACLQCEGGCGVSARVVDGAVVKLEGNPLHPLNRGRLCALGQAALQEIYSPDRIKAPMRRAKGSNQWSQISWDEAIGTITTELNKLRDQRQSHSLVVFDGYYPGLMGKLLSRFCEAYGTPNHIVTTPIDGTVVAHSLSQGIDDRFAYDFENTNYVLSFGCGLLDGWRNRVAAARAYGFLRQERAGAKAKIVQIERRFSTTASRADEWVPINPGKEGALALAIAYVIIREGLYDRQFVEDYTFGFDDWTDSLGQSHMGFKTLVLQEYRPDDVAEATGVPVDTIIRIAKEFASNRPAIAIADENATHYVNGTYNALAIHSLNALLGSIEVKGGVLLAEEVPFKELPPLEQDEVARDVVRMPRIDLPASARVCDACSLDAIPGNILKAQPYNVNAIFFCNSNPVFSARAREDFGRALRNVPLVVSFSSFFDESAEHADLVLPDHLMLEKWIDAPAPPMFGTPAVAIAQPAIKPLYDTMHTGDCVLKIASTMSPGAFPWSDYKELLAFGAEGLHESERGAVFSEPSEEAYTRELQERGWDTNEASQGEDFWQALTEKGGWSGLVREYGRWGKAFQTPSTKFEFFSQHLKDKLETTARDRNLSLNALLDEMRIAARGDTVFLPHHEPIVSTVAESDFPYLLNPFSLATMNGSSANIPSVQEVVGAHVNVEWNSWAEINPATARQIGVSDADEVWIESSRGRIKTEARLYAGAMPNVINVPSGFGHTALGRWAKDVGANPNSILEIAEDGLSGLPALFSTRVKVYKA
jgi:anaerobic selenocysteine-containing dehydrogenase